MEHLNLGQTCTNFSKLHFIFFFQNYIFCKSQTDFLRQIISLLKEYHFFPGNYIAFQGEINDSMYFINSGEVEVLDEKDSLYFPTKEDILKEGDVFGMVRKNLSNINKIYFLHILCI